MDKDTFPAFSSFRNVFALVSKKLLGRFSVTTLVLIAFVPLFTAATVISLVGLHKLSIRLAALDSTVAHMESRVALKQAEFSGKLNLLDGQVVRLANSPALKEVETLAPRVSLLEKQFESIPFRSKITAMKAKPVRTEAKDYYEVKEGDTLYQISRKYHVPLDELARMNGIQEEDFIVAGQKLVLEK